MSSEQISLDKAKNGNTTQVEAVAEDEELSYSGHVAPKYLGSVADRRDMSALGKEQVLRVRARDVA